MTNFENVLIALTVPNTVCVECYINEHCKSQANCSIPVILPDYQLRWTLRRGWLFLINHRSINKTLPRLSLGQTTITVVDDDVVQRYGTCALLLTLVNRSTRLRCPTTLTTRLLTVLVSPTPSYARATQAAYISRDRTMWCTHQGLTSPVPWPALMYLRF